MPRKKSEKPVEQEEFDVDEPSEIEELENNATDDDWTPADDEAKKPGRPQRAVRNRKPIKLIDGNSSEEEEDEEAEDSEGANARGSKRKRNVATRGGKGSRGRGRPPATAQTQVTPPSTKKAKTDENGRGRAKKKEKVEKEEVAEGEAEDDDMDDVEDEEGLDDDDESVSEEEETDDESETEDAEIPPEFKSGKFVLLKSDFDNKEENYPLWKIDGKSLLQKFDKFVHNNEELYKGTTIYAGWSKAVIDTYYPITVDIKTLVNGESTVKFDSAQITEEMQKAPKGTPLPSLAPATAAQLAAAKMIEDEEGEGEGDGEEGDGDGEGGAEPEVPAAAPDEPDPEDEPEEDEDEEEDEGEPEE